MFKNRSFILTVILPIFVSLIIGILVIVLNNNSVLNTRAAATIAQEKNSMTKDMAELKKEKNELSHKEAELDKVLEENKILINEITALTDELNDYTLSIENAKQTIAELDSAITDKTTYNESLKGLSQNNPQTKKTYTNKTLTVPLDISEGRYTAEGTGKLMIYTGSKLKDKAQDLSLIDTHSYTFDIQSGQSVKIIGTIHLTKISE